MSKKQQPPTAEQLITQAQHEYTSSIGKLKNALQQVRDLQQQVQTQQQQLQQERELFEQEKQQFVPPKEAIIPNNEQVEKQLLQLQILLTRLSLTSKQAKQKIKLDIGGTLFATTLDTITSEKPTFFSAWFSDEFFEKPGEDGTYFVDRSPDYFKYVLEYLRTKKCSITNLSAFEIAKIKEEAKFYCVNGLLECLEPQLPSVHFDATKCFPGILLTKNCTHAKLDSVAYPGSRTVLCTNSVSKMRVTCIQNCQALLFGLVNVAHFDMTSQDNVGSKYHYFVNCTNTALYAGALQLQGVSYYSKTPHCIGTNGTCLDLVYEDLCLRLFVNGIDYGVVYSNLPSNLVFAFTFYHSGSEIEIAPSDK